MGTGGDDTVRAQKDSYRAQADSDRAGSDSVRAQDDSDRKDRRAIYRVLAYLGMGLAGALGLWYVQGIADEAHDTATTVDDREKKEEAEEEIEQRENCQVRNRATANGRARFVKLNENLASIVAQSDEPAETQAFIDILFKGINLDPAAEDLDCNGDGELTDADYAP